MAELDSRLGGGPIGSHHVEPDESFHQFGTGVDQSPAFDCFFPLNEYLWHPLEDTGILYESLYYEARC